jgi:hypothetical protein
MDYRLGPDDGDGRRDGSSGAMVTPDRSQPTKRVDLHAGPPPTLIGTDPLMKEADESFSKGFDDWRDGIPPGMAEHIAKGLTNAIVDVVALPDGLSGSSIGAEGGNGEVLEELTHQGRSGTVDTVGRADLQWRNGKRTSLRTIKKEDTLRKRFGILIKLRHKVAKRMVTSTTNACKRSGWTDDHRIQAWAYGGYLTKMLLDSFDLYLSLHQHLLQMADVERATWDYVQLEIKHHTEEPATIPLRHGRLLSTGIGNDLHVSIG